MTVVRRGCHCRGVSDTTSTPPSESSAQAVEGDPADALALLEELVPVWLSVPEAAQLQGISLSATRAQLKERQLVGVRRGPNKAISIPAVFVTEEGPRPEIRGTVIVLSDGGMSDVELLRWLFTPDDTLPVSGSPMDCILAGHKTEIRRRAMETAF